MSGQKEELEKSRISKKLLGLALVSILTATLVVTLWAQPASAKAQTTVLGVNIGGLTEDRARLAKQAGINWVRSDVTFGSSFQRIYTIANRYGFNIIGILDYDTLNSNKSFVLADWQRAVTKAQQLYPSIRVWEIWNEPTLTKYQLGYMDGTPQHYLELLLAAYRILKGANPQYTVLGLGGAQLGASKDLPFAQAVFSAGGSKYMDAISIHAYPTNLNKGKIWDYFNAAWTRELLAYKQFGKPFWVTETGLESNQNNEQDQAAYLKEAYYFFAGQGAVGFMWFQLVDYGTDSRTVLYGLIRMDMTTKPSYTTFKSL